MIAQVQAEFGAIDIYVSNARTEVTTFYQGPMTVTLEQWDTARDSQAEAFLVGAREVSGMMKEGGRIIGITYAPGGRTGSWQPWVGWGQPRSPWSRYAVISLWPWRSEGSP